MAILQATRTTSDPAAAAQRRSARQRRTREALPLLGMGVVVTVSVGYGMGTLVQFDRDWREATPVAIAHAVGTIPGDTPLGEAIVGLLAASARPVDHVTCGSTSPVEGLVGDQLCRAHSRTGMVDIVARSSGDVLSVTVFSGRNRT